MLGQKSSAGGKNPGCAGVTAMRFIRAGNMPPPLREIKPCRFRP